MHIILRYVGKGVSPRGISRELGGDPHEGCLLGDLIEVRKADGSIERKPALTGYWRRTVDFDSVSSGAEALSILFAGLTTDLSKYVRLSHIHRCDIAVVEAPRETTVDGLFSSSDLEFLTARGLRVDIYYRESDVPTGA